MSIVGSVKCPALFLSFCLFPSLSSSAQETFSISGHIPGMCDSAEVVLVTDNGLEPKRLASSGINDGQFVLTGEFRRPELCKMRFYIPGKKDKINVCSIRVLTDSKPVTFTADTATILHSDISLYAEAKVRFEGSEAQAQYVELLNATRAKEDAADSARYAQSRAWFENNCDNEAIADYKQRAEAAEKEYEACVEDFLVAHPDYYPTAAILAQRIYKDFTYTAEQYDGFLDLLKNNPDTAHVNLMRRNMETVKKYALGARYTDFQGKCPDNSMASLSSLMQEGKYTLVDFWASWCGPCRAAIPKVKAMAEEFKDFLQVVSVSLDEKEENWRKAEEAEDMPWPQMIVPRESYNDVAMAYMINSIPRLVLISPEGGIVVATFDTNKIKEKLLEVKR